MSGFICSISAVSLAISSRFSFKDTSVNNTLKALF